MQSSASVRMHERDWTHLEVGDHVGVGEERVAKVPSVDASETEEGVLGSVVKVVVVRHGEDDTKSVLSRGVDHVVADVPVRELAERGLDRVRRANARSA